MMEAPKLELTEEGKKLLVALTFDEETHTYTCNGKKVYSVTQILERQGLAPNYAFVKRDIMKKGADRGTTIHKEIEEYNKDKTIGFTEECQFYIDLIESNNIVPLLAECKVTDGRIAGMFDELLWVPDDDGGCLVIVDNKTTSSIHWESVSWQLSIYAYLVKICYGVEVTKGAVIWLPKTKYGKFQFRYVDLKSNEEVKKVLEAEENDKIYRQEYPCDTDIISELEGLKLEKEKIDARIKELSEQVLQDMEGKGCFSFDTGYAKFTRVITEGKETFDSKKYREDNPEIDFSAYIKKSAKSTSLKITFNKKEKNTNA